MGPQPALQQNSLRPPDAPQHAQAPFPLLLLPFPLNPSASILPARKGAQCGAHAPPPLDNPHGVCVVLPSQRIMQPRERTHQRFVEVVHKFHLPCIDRVRQHLQLRVLRNCLCATYFCETRCNIILRACRCMCISRKLSACRRCGCFGHACQVLAQNAWAPSAWCVEEGCLKLQGSLCVSTCRGVQQKGISH